jgi:hypothetical protein
MTLPYNAMKIPEVSWLDNRQALSRFAIGSAALAKLVREGRVSLRLSKDGSIDVNVTELRTNLGRTGRKVEVVRSFTFE